MPYNPTLAVNNHLPSVRQTNRRLPTVMLRKPVGQAINNGQRNITWDNCYLDDIGIGNLWNPGDIRFYMPAGFEWVRHHVTMCTNYTSGSIGATVEVFLVLRKVTNGVDAYQVAYQGPDGWSTGCCCSTPWTKITPGDYWYVDFAINGNYSTWIQSPPTWSMEFDGGRR